MSIEVTRTAEPKPGWWGSLIAQLTGRSTEREIEQDTTTSEEAPPVETELVEVTEPEVPELEIDRHAAPVYDPDLIAAGRAWIGECVWSDLEPDYVAELTDDEVISGIVRHYDGGVHAFEESRYTVVDVPLPFEVDENGFPTEHRTFQSHTLPDDTHSWLCGKEGCYNGAADYATPDESLAAAQEHEISHGYDRELEVAAPDDEVTIEELDGPEADTEEIEHTAADEVTIEDVEPAAVEERDEVHTAAPEDGVCELPGNEPEVVTPEPVLTGTQQKAVVWTNALEDGTHTQAHGVWQKEGVFGGIKAECTIRAGGNALGLTDYEMRETFGDELFYECLWRNDGEKQPFTEISKAIKKDQGIEDLEMDR